MESDAGTREDGTGHAGARETESRRVVGGGTERRNDVGGGTERRAAGTRDGGSRDAVLLPCGMQLKTYAYLRSLGGRGIHTIVASELERNPLTASRYCDESLTLGARPQDIDDYKDELLAIAAREDVRAIVPVREYDAFLLAKYRNEFEEVVSTVSPDSETLRRAHDRYRLAEAAEAAGVPRAETRLLSAVDTWDERVVIKPRYNLLTNDYVETVAEGYATEVKDVTFVSPGDDPDVAAIATRMNHDPVVQAFVPQERKILYTALWYEGEPLATYQHEQLRQNSWVGGGGVYRVSTYSETVDEVATRLLGHLDWHGLACIEYVKDAETGAWTFLEINPRVWQSTPEAVRAGVDFPHHFWRAATGDPVAVGADYEEGIACHNAYGEVGHLLSVLRDDSPFLERPSFFRRAFEILSSCVTNPRFEYIRRDDPKLFLAAIRETLSAGVTRSRNFDDGSTRDDVDDGSTRDEADAHRTTP